MAQQFSTYALVIAMALGVMAIAPTPKPLLPVEQVDQPPTPAPNVPKSLDSDFDGDSHTIVSPASQLEERFFQLEDRVYAFEAALQETLGAALAEGGPSNALYACSIQGPQFSDMHSDRLISVRRVSDRPRNPENAASELDLQKMARFVDSIEQYGEFGVGPHASSGVAGNGVVIEMVKFIVIKEPCLACHGQNIAPSVQKMLDGLYPDDQATGYKLGDLRGAFIGVSEPAKRRD